MPKISATPYLYKKGKQDTDNCAIAIRIGYDGKYRYKETNHSAQPKYWDGKEVMKGGFNRERINADLHEQCKTVLKDLTAIQNAGSFTIGSIENYLSGKKVANKSFTQVVLEYAEAMGKTGKKTDGTIKTYHIYLQNFAGFLKVKEVYFEQITPSVLEDYEIHLKELGYEPGTIYNNVTKFFRKFFNIAKDKYSMILPNPFKGYERPKRPNTTTTAHLTMEECMRIENKLPNFQRSEQIVAKYFLLECYSGLRFSDWKRFKSESTMQGKALKVNTKKNKQPVYLSTKYRPRLAAILKDLPPFCFSNKTTNLILKSIAVQCDIDKNLTTHVGRHTFGTLHGELGYNSMQIAEMMAITPRQAEYYTRVTRNTIIQAEKELGGL